MASKLPQIENTQTILSLPALTSLHVKSSDADWQPVRPGLMTKTLFENSQTGERVLLFKSEPGQRSEPHAHSELEHVYVLSGSMFDDDRLLQAGDYCVRAPGAVHAGGTDEGAVTLVVYTPSCDT